MSARTEPPRLKGGHVPPSSAPHIEHPPAWAAGQRATQEIDHPLRIGFVPVRVEVQVFLAEPFFEPFRHAAPSPAARSYL